jgi:hypothetical protein
MSFSISFLLVYFGQRGCASSSKYFLQHLPLIDSVRRQSHYCQRHSANDMPRQRHAPTCSASDTTHHGNDTLRQRHTTPTTPLYVAGSISDSRLIPRNVQPSPLFESHVTFKFLAISFLKVIATSSFYDTMTISDQSSHPGC